MLCALLRRIYAPYLSSNCLCCCDTTYAALHNPLPDSPQTSSVDETFGVALRANFLLCILPAMSERTMEQEKVLLTLFNGWHEQDLRIRSS